MPQYPQPQGDAMPQFRQDCQASSPPVPEPSPRPNYLTRFIGSLWRAGMVIGILLILFVSRGTAAPPQLRPAPDDKAAVSTTTVTLKTSLQSVLYTLRDAIVQKDFDKYVSATPEL
jgi:hypothetical protein